MVGNEKPWNDSSRYCNELANWISLMYTHKKSIPQFNWKYELRNLILFALYRKLDAKWEKGEEREENADKEGKSRDEWHFMWENFNGFLMTFKIAHFYITLYTIPSGTHRNRMTGWHMGVLCIEEV